MVRLQVQSDVQVTLMIDDREITVPEGTSIMRALFWLVLMYLNYVLPIV